MFYGVLPFTNIDRKKYMLINPLYWPTLDIVSLQDAAFESINVSLSSIYDNIC